MNDKLSLEHILASLTQIEPSEESTGRAVERARRAVVDQDSHLRTPSHKTTRLANEGRRDCCLCGSVCRGAVVRHVRFSGSLALADVQSHVQETRSVQYVETEESYSPRDKLHGPVIVRKVFVLGRYLERRDAREVSRAISWRRARSGVQFESERS